MAWRVASFWGAGVCAGGAISAAEGKLGNAATSELMSGAPPATTVVLASGALVSVAETPVSVRLADTLDSAAAALVDVNPAESVAFPAPSVTVTVTVYG